MKNRRRVIIKKAIIIVILAITVLLLILGVQSSDFSKLKKYDVADKSPRGFIQQIGSSKSDSMSVSIVGQNEVNLGDFVFNVSGNKKLIANISIIHKPKDNVTFLDSPRDEFTQKAALLRDATIDAMLESKNFEMNLNNNKISKNIKKRLNQTLKDSTVEEVYFNKFIVQ